mmetsp:Transcript_13371/g.21150  ORF Transcript_13371/g.21150 Transcript_13371/m.21150 type:complete len:319 (-) Transcript_13371:3072-4028(-)
MLQGAASARDRGPPHSGAAAGAARVPAAEGLVPSARAQAEHPLPGGEHHHPPRRPDDAHGRQPNLLHGNVARVWNPKLTCAAHVPCGGLLRHANVAAAGGAAPGHARERDPDHHVLPNRPADTAPPPLTHHYPVSPCPHHSVCPSVSILYAGLPLIPHHRHRNPTTAHGGGAGQPVAGERCNGQPVSLGRLGLLPKRHSGYPASVGCFWIARTCHGVASISHPIASVGHAVFLASGGAHVYCAPSDHADATAGDDLLLPATSLRRAIVWSLPGAPLQPRLHPFWWPLLQPLPGLVSGPAHGGLQPIVVLPATIGCIQP